MGWKGQKYTGVEYFHVYNNRLNSLKVFTSDISTC